MDISLEVILIMLAIGLVAGWLAGLIVFGSGLGVIADMAVGIIGSVIGSWLLPKLGIALGGGIVAAIVNATIGAVVLLLVVGLVRRAGYGPRSR
jgi:uncharacterized membrane protein YeaQ/YmgE (transglycosylase-associated protein family)